MDVHSCPAFCAAGLIADFNPPGFGLFNLGICHIKLLHINAVAASGNKPKHGQKMLRGSKIFLKKLIMIFRIFFSDIFNETERVFKGLILLTSSRYMDCTGHGLILKPFLLALIKISVQISKSCIPIENVFQNLSGDKPKPALRIRYALPTNRRNQPRHEGVCR